MIHVYGTSHVSEESLELVEEKIEQIDPEVVALELDYSRLKSMLEDSREAKGSLFVRFIKNFQEVAGSRTGVMPGDEMLYAYEIAIQEGKDVALIDQDISVTLEKLKEVRRVEKVRAAVQVVIGMIYPGRMDLEDIPEDRFIEELLEEFRHMFPDLHRVLIEDRNRHMVEALKQLGEENDGDIVAFVGAGHKNAIREGLRREIDS
ncbi:MAG: TraB domain-containing protein [Candidatus Nanohaloarchaea archaeon]